jgi:hypothetical protein
MAINQKSVSRSNQLEINPGKLVRQVLRPGQIDSETARPFLF